MTEYSNNMFKTLCGGSITTESIRYTADTTYFPINNTIPSPYPLA